MSNDRLNPVVVWSTLGLLFVAILAFVYLRDEAVNPVVPPTPITEHTAPDTPSGDNVSHAFRLRLDSLRTAVSGSPRDTTAMVQLAHLLHDAHQLDEAAVTYQQILELVPGNRKALLDLTSVFAGLKDFEKAGRTARELLAFHPDDPHGQYNMGAILANQGDKAGARSWWEKVITQTDHPDLVAQAKASLAHLEASVGF